MEKKRWIFDAHVTRVVDGDTIEAILYLSPDEDIDLGFGIRAAVPHTTFKTKLRIRDIDTAEIYGVKKDSEEYIEGLKSKEFVEAWVLEHGPLVRVETFKRTFDRYEADVYEYCGFEEEEYSLAKAVKDAGFDKSNA